MVLRVMQFGVALFFIRSLVQVSGADPTMAELLADSRAVLLDQVKKISKCPTTSNNNNPVNAEGMCPVWAKDFRNKPNLLDTFEAWQTAADYTKIQYLDAKYLSFFESCLLPTYKQSFNEQGGSGSNIYDRGWYYFGKQSDGAYANFPATDMCPTDYWNNFEGAGIFDPRTRPWYQNTVTGPIDIIFMVDSTMSMEKFGNGVFDELKQGLLKIAKILGSHNFVDVYSFGGEGFDSFSDSFYTGFTCGWGAYGPCMEGLVPATEDNKPAIESFISSMSIREGKFEQGNWREMFEHLMKNRAADKKNSGCRCFLFLILDGDIDVDLDWFQKQNLESGTTPCTLIAVGVGAPDLPMLKRMTCETDGFVSWQQPIYNVYQYMYQFIAAASPPRIDVRYTEYITVGLINTLISACAMVREANAPNRLVGVNCVDLNTLAPIAPNDESTFERPTPGSCRVDYAEAREKLNIDTFKCAEYTSDISFNSLNILRKEAPGSLLTEGCANDYEPKSLTFRNKANEALQAQNSKWSGAAVGSRRLDSIFYRDQDITTPEYAVKYTETHPSGFYKTWLDNCMCVENTGPFKTMCTGFWTATNGALVLVCGFPFTAISVLVARKKPGSMLILVPALLGLITFSAVLAAVLVPSSLRSCDDDMLGYTTLCPYQHFGLYIASWIFHSLQGFVCFVVMAYACCSILRGKQARQKDLESLSPRERAMSGLSEIGDSDDESEFE